MDKVSLSKAARKALSERLGRPVPDPDSEAFDELLEELREMQPDAYTDLMDALEHKGERLPVEKEALRAHKRVQRQKVADHLKNRQTHDGKRVPDKRKSLLLGLALAGCLMGWMGYTNISRGFTARATSTAEQPAAQEPVVNGEKSSFSLKAGAPDLGAELDLLENVQVAQPAPPPPPKDLPVPAEEPQPEPAKAESSLPFGLGRTVDTPQDEPENKLPPVPSPPQPSVASAPPASPYLPAQPGGTPTAATEASPLPGNLSFVPLEPTLEGPTNVLSTEGDGEQDTGLPSAPGTTLTVNGSTEQAAPTPAASPPTSLGGVGSEEETPAASTLGWEDPDGQNSAVEEENLSFATDSQQGGLTESAANPAASAQPLPPVPQVGGATPPPPATQEPAQRETVSELEVTDLSTLLTPGTQLQAELVTGVAAAVGAATPVIAKTTGNWCGESTCSEITWIGEASYPGADRVELTFTQAVVGNTAQSVTARVFSGDQLLGVQAGVRDAVPTAVQDLIRGVMGGASEYLDALNSRETVIIREGEIVRQRAEPDLGTYLLGRGAELFSLPGDQTSIVRLAEVAPGTLFTVIYGL